ncbi:formyltetrahydrofolate deformylase [Sphingomonas sp. MAH-20]|uniref:Formyltetrahydrofolate deformylase n=1 Tax=Sphingomonas horti TaxID=2682842 RepID=A0A6I4J4W5_9SPHN|nr:MULTISPECIES: formyltetrahydrofolate deformylase [Sphingomonas]MBA2921012.1 formyltetrahydrofolate deformylase [Sphingomonas sp. CGMCC 1.13658]MVO79525.1 formyltetrahydrofolate deformylase [Sphingomonas horti]
MQANRRFILTATCPDIVGIVAAVAGFLAERSGFILESQQHSDPETGRFFLRIEFTGESGIGNLEIQRLNEEFEPIAKRFAMAWTLADAAVKPRVLIAVSRFGHCLNDLLHRWSIGALSADIVGVISNHQDMRGLTEWHGLPFIYLPVGTANRAEQEAAILDLMERQGADLLVLARYMQVLSDATSSALAWRCINIHHSFLPSFKGAKPYHQAYERGVKIVGATAHYVTSDLDEGPIIEQDVERVDHRMTADELVELGRDIEARVLARAVRWHAERKILPNGGKTVVFR